MKTRLVSMFAIVVAGLFAVFSADAFEYNGLEFHPISDSTCEVNAPNRDLSGTVSLPSKAVEVDYKGISHTYSVVTVGDFSYCEGITSVIIPNSIEKNGFGAFSHCVNLTRVEFGTGLKVVEVDAFSGCQSLQAVEMTSLKQWCEIEWGPTGGVTASPLSNGAKLFIGGALIHGHLRIPEGVERIGAHAFCYYPEVTSVEIPSTVKSIGCNAFSGEYLNSVVIGSGVEEMASDVFGLDDSSDYFPEKVIWLPKTQPRISEVSFKNSRGRTNYVPSEQYKLQGYVKCYLHLNDIFVVNGIVYVPTDYSEGTCDIVDYHSDTSGGLSDLVVPETVERSWNGKFKVENIARSAFYKDDFITSVTLNNHGNVDFKAFYGCSHLRYAILNAYGDVGGSQSLINYPTMKDMKERAGYTAGAFQACGNLSDVTIHSAVMSIGDNTFNNCTSLESVLVMPRQEPLAFGTAYDYGWPIPLFAGCPLKNVSCFGKIAYSEVSPFQNNATLSSVLFEGDVRDVPPYVCSYCQQLESLDLREGIRSVGKGAFKGCANIKSLSLPGSLNNIADEAFEGCTGLENLKIGDNVVSIGARAFANCDDLTSLTLGRGLESVENGAFECDYAIQEIHSYNPIPPHCADDVFSEEIVDVCQLVVPKNSIAQYRGADVWKEFLNVSENELDGNAEIGIDDSEVSIESTMYGFKIIGLGSDVNVGVYDVSGRIIYNGNNQGEYMLPSGLYIVKTSNFRSKIVVF